MILRRSGILATIGLLAACGPNWQPVSVPQANRFDARTVVDFHVGEKIVRLHGVAMTRDSISGIPWLEHLSCDTCRVSYALIATSQMRTGNPGAGAWNIMIPLAGVLGLTMALFLSFPRD